MSPTLCQLCHIFFFWHPSPEVVLFHYVDLCPKSVFFNLATCAKKRVQTTGGVVLSFRALSGRLKCTVRRHKFNKDSLSCGDGAPSRAPTPNHARNWIQKSMGLNYEPSSEPQASDDWWRWDNLARPYRISRPRTREFFLDNLLVRIHFIILMSRWTGLAPWEFEFPFPGSFTSTFLY